MSSFLAKQQEMIFLFQDCPTAEARYEKIISIGRKKNDFPENQKIASHIVPGCQSILYLYTTLQNGVIYFQTYSEALISAGLAQILAYVYSEQSPATVLHSPPLFLQTSKMIEGLTPGRSNGIANLYLQMKKDTISLLSKSIDSFENPSSVACQSGR